MKIKVLIIVAALIFVCGVAGSIWALNAPRKNRVEIKSGGRVLYTLDLSREENRTFTVSADKGVNVHVSSLGDSAVTIEAFGWVPGSEYLSSKWYITEEIKLQYDAEGIKIPYPQVDLHLDGGSPAAGSADRITAKE